VIHLLSPVLRWGTLSRTAGLRERYGIRLANSVADQNEALYEARVFTALDLLHRHSPSHLAWLRTHYPVLSIGDVRRGALVQEAHPAGVLRLSPRFVWKASPEQLALELVAASARTRAARTRRCPVDLARDERLRILGYRERIWFARRLPNSERLAQEWAARLAKHLDATRRARTHN
jgi:hypothetical protein